MPVASVRKAGRNALLFLADFIGSVTKQFTATAVMMLVEEGKIGLDEKIARYLTGLPEAWTEVAVRQLLTHTSGIESYTGVSGFEKIMLAPVTQVKGHTRISHSGGIPGFTSYIARFPADRLAVIVLCNQLVYLQQR